MLRGQQGNRGHWGLSGMHWGAGRECRCSGTSRGMGALVAHRDVGGIGGVGVHWGGRSVGTQGPAVYRAIRGNCGLLGVLGAIRGCQGGIGADRECRCSGVSKGVGGIRGHWGVHRSVGAIRGCRGVRGALGLAGSVVIRGQQRYRCIGGS